MLTSLRRGFLVIVILGSLAVFGYLVYTGMGAKTRANISADLAGNGEVTASKEGLVAQWNFNETNGDAARSEGSCGKQCDGQLVNFAYTGSQDAALGTGWTAKNKLWSAGSLMFDGVNDLVKVDGTKDLDINGAGSKLTIELWFKPNSLYNEWQALIFKGSESNDCAEPNCSNRQYTLWLNKDGFIHFTSSPQGLSGIQHSINTPPGTIRVGELYHVAAVIDSTDGRMQVYVNGKLRVSVSDYGKAGIRSAKGNLIIGNRPDGTAAFNGVIDAVRIYSRALSEREILANFVTSFPSPSQSLTATPAVTGTPNASEILFKVRMPDVAPNVGTVKDMQVVISNKTETLYDFKVDLQRVQGTDFFIANPVELDIPDGYYTLSVKHAKTLRRTFTVKLTKGKALDCTGKDADTSCESLGRPDLAPLYSGDSDGGGLIDAADLQRLVSGYGVQPLPPEPNGDFNLDGKIDVHDLGILGKNFGKKGD
jgi:hypothetical protein